MLDPGAIGGLAARYPPKPEVEPGEIRREGSPERRGDALSCVTLPADMNVRFPALVLVLALCAGPATALCSDCCPHVSVGASLAAAVGCCGNCQPTLDRGHDPAIVATNSAIVPTDVLAVVLGPPESSIRIGAILPRVAEFTPRIVSPPTSQVPLRL